jgi:hypothetical protein
MLTRAGVDCSVLDIIEDPEVWADLETGEQATSVVITGQREARRAAAAVLYEAGLSNAPYSDLDMWSDHRQADREAGQ